MQYKDIHLLLTLTALISLT